MLAGRDSNGVKYPVLASSPPFYFLLIARVNLMWEILDAAGCFFVEKRVSRQLATSRNHPTTYKGGLPAVYQLRRFTVYRNPFLKCRWVILWTKLNGCCVLSRVEYLASKIIWL